MNQRTRHFLTRTLIPEEILPFSRSDLSISKVKAEENEKLGALMYAAYQGTIDYEGESLTDSVGEISETFQGKYGAFLFEPSLVAWKGDLAVAAALYVHYPEKKMPLLVYTMTHPQFKGQGLAQYLLKKSGEILQRQGFAQCGLYVTEGNDPAEFIYKKLGFQEV